jgi:hypothetical protein
MKRTILIAMANALAVLAMTAAWAAPGSGSGHARGTLLNHQARLGLRGSEPGPHGGELAHAQWRHCFRFRHLAGESKGEGVHTGWDADGAHNRLYIDEDGDGICDHAPGK